MFSLRFVLSAVLAMLILAPAALAQACTGSSTSTCRTDAGSTPLCHDGECYFRSCTFPGYTETGTAVTSGGHSYHLCKRTLTGSIYRRRRDLNTCPGTEQRCPVMHGRGGTECLDVMSNVESCGGCMFDDATSESASGVDCTEIPGAAAVQCNKGKCVIDECYQGYKLNAQHGTCTPIAGMRIQKNKNSFQRRW